MSPDTPSATVSAKELFVLGRLSIRPTHGHEIMRTLAESHSEMWVELSEKHVYYILRKLERDGLVSADVQPQQGRPARRVFSLTAAGRAEFAQLMTADSLVESMPYSDFDVVFGMLAYTDSLSAAEKTAVLERRAAYLRGLADRATDANAGAPDDRPAAAVLSARVFERISRVAEAELAWLTDVIAAVEDDGWPNAPTNRTV
jgi:DNA-binding PadR family transcriptional regulator